MHESKWLFQLDGSKSLLGHTWALGQQEMLD